MRYGLAELLLVQPGAAAHRPAPAADAPGVRQALALAEGLDQLEEHEAMELGLAAAHVFNAARHPERLMAPPPWPQELALLSGTVLLGAIGGRVTGWRSALRWGPPWAAAAAVLARARLRAERRAARRLGLTALTAPQRSLGLYLPVFLALAVYALLRLTGRVRRPLRQPWPTLAAQEVIRRLDQRRNWWRAYAAAGARSPQARSSAESSTSGGWAPEKP
jgi:hypothetical protein